MASPCDEDWRVLTTLLPAGRPEVARSKRCGQALTRLRFRRRPAADLTAACGVGILTAWNSCPR